MSIFEPSTPVEASPIEGQEVETAEVEQEQEEILNDDQGIQEDELDSDQEENEEELPLDDEQGQEELIAGKFKSQDDLIKAYKNLEREFHKSRQHQQEPTQPQQPERDVNEMFWEDFQSNPFATLHNFVQAMVENQTAPIFEQQSNTQISQNISELSHAYPQINTEDGLRSLYTKVQEIASEEGLNASKPSKRLLKIAADELFADSKATLYQKAKAEGKRQAEQTRRSKLGLSGPKNTKPKQTEKTPEELIAESIVKAGSRGGIFS